MAKKRLKKNVHRAMTKRLRGNRTSKKGLPSPEKNPKTE